MGEAIPAGELGKVGGGPDMGELTELATVEAGDTTIAVVVLTAVVSFIGEAGAETAGGEATGEETTKGDCENRNSQTNYYSLELYIYIIYIYIPKTKKVRKKHESRKKYFKFI